MSNLIFNVRFGEWHFQIRRDWPWLSFTHNDYQAHARKQPGWRWFQVH